MRNPPVSSHPYPVNLDLSGRSVLVVGAGAVAARKVQGLIAAGARVTVVAPEAVSELAEASANGAIRWQQRTYRRGEVASYRLAVAATGDPDVNGQVHWDAEAAGVWLNAADDPDRCSFTLPAVVRRGDLQVPSPPTVARRQWPPGCAAPSRSRSDPSTPHSSPSQPKFARTSGPNAAPPRPPTGNSPSTRTCST